VMGVVGMK